MQGGQDKSLCRRDAEIFVVSALILYLELVLIRWIGTEIRVFAYLGNLILMICFFAVGLGCYRSERPARLSRVGVNLLLLAVLVANPLHLAWLNLSFVTELLSGFEDSLIWQEMRDWRPAYAVGGLLIVGGLLYFITLALIPLGQILGRCLNRSPHTIWAYSLNIAGSLIGVWLFALLSWRWSPPAMWFGVATALLVPLVWKCSWNGWCAVGCLATATLVVALGADRHARTVWSPYQKLTLSPFYIGHGTNVVQQGFRLEVNGVSYQHLVNLSDDFLAAHSDIFDKEQAGRSYYNLPFHFKHDIRRMLIIGAGSGNNAAAGLRHGVEQIDCVEIDPVIYALGLELHPEQAYRSPHVHMVVEDARAFFKRAGGQYDLIWFALLDAHTLGSSFNNLRLDHYVYTQESLSEAKTLLAPGGLLVMDFDAQRAWVTDRLWLLLKKVFGHEPLAYVGDDIPNQYGVWSGCTLLTGTKPVTLDAVDDDSIHRFLKSKLIHPPGTARVTTDDWPYLYLRQARVPTLHLVVSATILGTIALAGRRMINVYRRFDTHFFALGAAFLLLEVQTVSRATLLFGMTWVVNAIVLSAVLVMILLSNLVAAMWPKLPQWFIVTGLGVTVAQLALVPLDWFNGLTAATKLVAASAFLTAPVFFAGLIFIRSFAACPDKSRALGSNLIGALVGGLLESLSFVTGIRALVLLVGLFYALAIGLRPSRTSDSLSALRP